MYQRCGINTIDKIRNLFGSSPLGKGSRQNRFFHKQSNRAFVPVSVFSMGADL